MSLSGQSNPSLSGTSTLQGIDPKTGRPYPQPVQPTNTGDAAVDSYTRDLSTAGGVAQQMLQGHEHARISDPYEQQRQEYVKYLQGRLGGLDSGEQRAMREEGIANLDQQTAQNLERYGSIAGANGVQGGARAGLMGKALHENNLGRAQLERQFVMDNIAIKDKAAQAYGGAMNDASNIALGVGKYNAGAADADTGALLGTTFDIMGGIGANRSEIKADDFISQSIKNALTNQNPSGTPNGQGGASTSPNTAPPASPGGPRTGGDIEQMTTQLNDLGAQVGTIMSSNDPGAQRAGLVRMQNQAKELIIKQLIAQYPEFDGLNDTNYYLADDKEIGNRFRDLFNQTFSEWKWNAGLTRRDGSLRY